MATKIVKEYSAFYEGIADFPKTGGPASYQLGRSVDHRTDTRSITLLPKTIKKSGSVVTDLVKWATTVPFDPFPTYLYGNTGNLYLRDSSSNYSLLRQIDSSHGNGLSWYGADNFIYYTNDNNLGKYGPLNGTPLFYDNIYTQGSGGLVNTAVLSLIASSSQYTEAPSTVANSITGDISLSCAVYFNDTIAGGATQTLVSKSNSTGNQKSYTFNITGIDADNFTLGLTISNDGTATESLTQNVNFTGYKKKWFCIQITWDASASTAKFYTSGILRGTVVGAMTSIFASSAPLAIGADKSSGAYANFLNGDIDNVSLWSQVISGVSTPVIGVIRLQELQGTEANLNAYYKFNNSYADSTLNTNDMVPHGSPLFMSTYNQQNIFIEPFTALNPGAYHATRPDTDVVQNLTGQTYTLTTGISESATDVLTWTPLKSPQASMAFNIDTLGTGNITLVIHDVTNAVIATKTYPVGYLQSAGYVEFLFDTPWIPNLGAQYHAHLYSSVGDTKVVTGTTADFSTAWFTTFFAFLNTDIQYHPIATMLNMLVIGNDNFVATINSTVYDPNTIQLPFGWKVRCFGFWNEYLAIGAWMGDTVDKFDRGRIFFWDGVALTYNFYIDVPEGAINAMVGSKGQLWFIAGSRCKLMIYEGGARAAKIKNLVNSENGNVIDIYPGAMSMWRLLLRFGVAGNSADSIIQEGVYTWGTVNERFPESLSFDYVISTGTYTGTTLHIGLVQAALNKLLIGWQDNATYGVDEVAVSNDPFAMGTVQFLIEDDGAMYHQKEAITVTTQFEPLTSGQSLTLKYRFDRAASFTSLPAITTVGQTTSRDVIATGVKRYREYEVALDLATSTSSSPIVLSVGIEKDVLETEKRVG